MFCSTFFHTFTQLPVFVHPAFVHFFQIVASSPGYKFLTLSSSFTFQIPRQINFSNEFIYPVIFCISYVIKLLLFLHFKHNTYFTTQQPEYVARAMFTTGIVLVKSTHGKILKKRKQTSYRLKIIKENGNRSPFKREFFVIHNVNIQNTIPFKPQFSCTNKRILGALCG